MVGFVFFFFSGEYMQIWFLKFFFLGSPKIINSMVILNKTHYFLLRLFFIDNSRGLSFYYDFIGRLDLQGILRGVPIMAGENLTNVDVDV